ncbi:MAG: cell surface protein, partial [Verrucomicrobiota bacterium]|nr:cell surface protein [Verrucomicrobiota bacterium]
MRHLLALLITLFCSTVMASKLERIEVFPTELNLASKRSKAQLVITGWLENGEARDLTRLAKIVIADKKVADLNRSIVIPIGDGETDILIRVGEHSVKLPVRVSRQSATDPIRFTTETLATLTKQGCNAGSCHGSPHGKAGFSLSLFGFDAAHDELSLIRGGLNRRVNVLAPDESLMLK